MNLSHILWPEFAVCRLGGGGSSGAAATQSAPVPTPAPPVTADNQSVIAAEQDMARQNLIKKSVKNTILAGDTGGYVAGNNPANAASPVTGYKAKLG